jgi:glucose dehydrogenase
VISLKDNRAIDQPIRFLNAPKRNIAKEKLLWEAKLPAAGNATPSTYEVHGRQFVVIAAGGWKSKEAPSGASIVACALPKPNF